MSGMLALGNNVELKKQRKNWKFKQNIKLLENEIKMEIKQTKKVITRVYLKKIKTDISKTWEAICCIAIVGRKSKCTPCCLKHNNTLLFNPVKIAETFNFFFTNIGPNITGRKKKSS